MFDDSGLSRRKILAGVAAGTGAVGAYSVLSPKRRFDCVHVYTERGVGTSYDASVAYHTLDGDRWGLSSTRIGAGGVDIFFPGECEYRDPDLSEEPRGKPPVEAELEFADGDDPSEPITLYLDLDGKTVETTTISSLDEPVTLEYDP